MIYQKGFSFFKRNGITNFASGVQVTQETRREQFSPRKVYDDIKSLRAENLTYTK